MSDTRQGSRRGPLPPFAVILGTNEIASAVAVHLFWAGHGVVLSHDPMPPVIRRRMAFHDALYDDAANVAGVVAGRAETSIEVRDRLTAGAGVTVTELGLLDLIVIGAIDILVDARMHKYEVTPDLRRLGRLAVGVGPGFSSGFNCDVAVETRPGLAGRVIAHGSTEPPDGVPSSLGGQLAARFARAEVAGRWHTAIEIGTRVYKDFIVGYLGGTPVRAPFDGFVRGVARDGTEVPQGVKLLEIDPRGRTASWTGIDARAGAIAKGVVRALARHKAARRLSTPQVHLIK
ncbi:xanthine dehydrogenase [Xanthobacter pseudotagetidis]|uniref:xanthine dehydrogenase n=1 Tax=Xanthobacter pseudotagetidis TaxID=3119911 RepID=UPI003727202E